MSTFVLNPKKTVSHAIKELISGPCAEAADLILTEVGVLNVQSEDFDDAITALGQSKHEETVSAVIRRLVAERHDDALTLDSAHTAAMTDRGERAYLLGLAVGLRLNGGAR